MERREQGNWLGPLHERALLHKRTPPGPYRPVKHYATTNVMEYFAEASEAMFALNDFYPWTRNDLWHHDPDGYRLIWEAWHDPTGFCPQQPASP